MLEDELRRSKKLPKNIMTHKRKKRKAKEELVLLPFNDEYMEELMDWLHSDDDKNIIKEFLFGCKGSTLSEVNIRDMFYKYKISHHIYEPFRI